MIINQLVASFVAGFNNHFKASSEPVRLLLNSYLKATWRSHRITKLMPRYKQVQKLQLNKPIKGLIKIINTWISQVTATANKENRPHINNPILKFA